MPLLSLGMERKLTPSRPQFFSETALPRGRVQAIITHVGIGDSPRDLRRYSVGVPPTMPLNLELNEPKLRKPTSSEISVTERSVSRSRCLARSIRRVSTYWWGVSPKVRLKRRVKWDGDVCARAASAATSSGSA